MPALKETYLQIKEMIKREIRQRTSAWMTQLLGQWQDIGRQLDLQDEIEDPVEEDEGYSVQYTVLRNLGCFLLFLLVARMALHLFVNYEWQKKKHPL